MNPTNDHQLIKVVLYTDNETRETFGVRTESVWASLTPEGNYTIENTPFFSLEVCTNDIVEVAPNTDEHISQEINPTYTIARIIQPSGHATVHVHALAPRDRNLELEADPSYAPFAELHKFIDSTEYTFEGNDCTQHYMSAIDIPPHIDPAPLFTKLDAGCQAAHWTYTHNHPTTLSPRVQSLITRCFSPEDALLATELLTQYAQHLAESGWSIGDERVHIAIIKTSFGTIDDLMIAIEVAEQDWRDVLVHAGFAEDVDAHRHWNP